MNELPNSDLEASKSDAKLTYTIPINISEDADGEIDDQGHWQATVDYINNEDYDYYEELDNTYDYPDIDKEENMFRSKSFNIYPEYLMLTLSLKIMQLETKPTLITGKHQREIFWWRTKQ